MGAGRKAAVGFFILGGLLLFGLALFLVGDRRRLFQESFQVYAEFERLGGLQEGARVRVAGVAAGEVLSISYPAAPDARFRVRMRVIEDLHGVVRTDSVASIQTEGLVGNMLVDIGEGTLQAPPVPDGGTIDSREPFEIADLMVRASEVADMLSTTIVTLGEELTSTVREVETAVVRVDGLLQKAGDDLVEMTRASRAVAQDVEGLVAEVRAGKGTVGKLLTDDSLHQRIDEIATELKAVSEDAQATFENIRDASEEARGAIRDFRSEDGAAPGLLAELSQTLGYARQAAANLAENTESMKRSFLFRGMFLERGFFDLNAITPHEYVEGALLGKHRVRRFWISADDLVELDATGQEVLSTRGIASIRSAMSEILRYPPNSPLMAEGYADTGSLDERYLKARRRAFLTREYIIREYFRDPIYTGFIHLESVTPKDLSGDDEDDGKGSSGVALALYYDADVQPAPRHRTIY